MRSLNYSTTFNRLAAARLRSSAKMAKGPALLLLLILSVSADVTAARTLNAGTNDELQSALRDARPGDTIEVAAGAHLVGSFTLPNKSTNNNQDWITIRTSAPDSALPSDNERITPAQTDVLAQIASPSSDPALLTEAGAHHYRFIGIEFTIAPDVKLNFGIVRLGNGDESDKSLLPHDLAFDRCYIHGQPLADVSRGIALNSASTDIVNCHIADIHGIGFDTQAICGWNGPGPFKIVNNYLEASGENVLFGGADPQISNLVPSDIEFRRNDCVKPPAWREGILARPANLLAAPLINTIGNLLSGATVYYRVAARVPAGAGSVATSAASDEAALALPLGQTAVSLIWDNVPLATEYRVYRTTDAPDAPSRQWTYYTATGTTFTDVGDLSTGTADTPPAQATRWSVKNLFELKNARRVIVDGNVMENCWLDAQVGFAVQLTPRNQDGHAPWSTVEDVTFTNNVIRHSAGGVNILGKDNLQVSQQVHNLLLRNNLFYDIGGAAWGGNGRFLQISEAVSVTLDHNTALQTGNVITTYGVPSSGFAFTNNLTPNNDFGVIGDGTASGNATIDSYLPASRFKGNALMGGQSSKYPPKNLFPSSIDAVGFVDPANDDFRLSSTSPLKHAGTKGKDVGADIDAIERAHGSINFTQQ